MKKYRIKANKALGQNFLINQSVVDKIVESSNITKEDFHNFRVILEKMANFYGYSKWDYLLSQSLPQKDEIIRLIDYYSQDSNDELEAKIIDSLYKELFIDYFNQFLEDYKWEAHDEQYEYNE